MNIALIIGAIALALFALSASKKVKNEDPRAINRVIENETTPAATQRRVQTATDSITRELGFAGLGIFGKSEPVVLRPEVVARMSAILYGRPEMGLYVGTLYGPRLFRTQAEYRAWYMETYKVPKPTLPFNYQKARVLAPKIAAHLRSLRGWYVPEYVQQFQEAAGLRNSKGETDGLYGGRTMGALCYYMDVDNCGSDKRIPHPLHGPEWPVRYIEPGSEQL